MTSRRRGLALAGGGPIGAIYEIGALVALDEALTGAKLNDFDIFVGVSSGSFFASGLANGITPRDMFSSFIENTTDDPFDPAVLLRPAIGEFTRRIVGLPGVFLTIASDWLGRPTRRGFMDAFEQLGVALPTGIYDNAGIARYLKRLFASPGRSNDFLALRKRLFVVATDLDTGRAVPFGAPGLDDVPISVAVAASAALPGLYPPVRHGGRHYVDGAVQKTLHASVALADGAKLLLCINPLVPFDSALAERRTGLRPPPLVESGLPLVMSQMFRAIIHSRMQVAMGRYASEYPAADIVLFEPAQDDPDMFFANVFSYADRRRLCEHAYQFTRQELLRRHDELAPILRRHGMGLDRRILQQQNRSLVAAPLPDAAKAGLGGTLAALDAALTRLSLVLTQENAEKQHGKTRTETVPV